MLHQVPEALCPHIAPKARPLLPLDVAMQKKQLHPNVLQLHSESFSYTGNLTAASTIMPVTIH
jgi:hypothetical protein